MGLKSKITDILLKREGSRYKNVDWIKRNKRWFGLAFFLASGYIVTFKCPGLEPYCAKLLLVLTNVGSLLTGAGVLDSDTREKFVQGILPKAE
jgi:hypothetical protein